MDLYEKMEELKNSGKTAEFVIGVNGATYRVRGTVVSLSDEQPVFQVKDESGKTHTLNGQYLVDVIED